MDEKISQLEEILLMLKQIGNTSEGIVSDMPIELKDTVNHAFWTLVGAYRLIKVHIENKYTSHKGT